MKRFALSACVVAPCLVIACTSTDVGSEPPPAEVDGGVDATTAPPPAADASRPDVAQQGFTPASRLPVTCAVDPCYVAVSGNGGEHTCGLLKDGTVRCWGRDTMPWSDPDGALGRGGAVSAIEGATPAPVVGLHDVTQISVGRNYGTCARTADGSVYCWGRNEVGQLGRDPAESRLLVPTRVDGLPPVSYVALGSSTGCAIATSDRALYCWGARRGAIGLAATPGDTPAFPPQVMNPFPPPVREVVLGSFSLTGAGESADTIMALLHQGVLASLGELPAGESSVPPGFSPIPLEVPGIARAGVFAYLTTDAVVSQWAPKKKTLHLTAASSLVDIAISARYVGGFPYPVRIEEQGGLLLSSGRLFRWGVNSAGELGYRPEDLVVVDDPVEMTNVGGAVVSFAMTSASTCASLVDGRVECWGSNLHGELGRGTIDAEFHPEAMVIK
ncbi:MAG: repeat domain protein [Labilithrix sp.]|nr:repeat domain protein [Labilithrix sp.]